MARRRSARSRGAGFRPAAAAYIAAGLAAAAGVALLVQNRLGAPLAMEGAADDAASRTVSAAGAPISGAADAWGKLTKLWAATDRIEALERENAELRQWRSMALALAARNERYEALLKMPADAFGEGLRPDAGIAARLVLDAGGPFRRTLLANAGADQGVKVGFVAVNENGLVGRVVSVARATSRVLLLDDYNSRVPVMAQASRVRAILVGEAGDLADLEGLIRMGAPELSYGVGAGALREGEAIFTSGDGGVFPAGLFVGVAAKDAGGGWRVKLGAASAPIDYVRIVPYAPVQGASEAPVPSETLPPPGRSPRELAANAAGIADFRAPIAAAPAPLAVVRPAPLPPPPPEPEEVDAPPAEPAVGAPAAAPLAEPPRP